MNVRATPVLVIAVAMALLPSCSSSFFEEPRRLGPPVLVAQENDAQLWILTKQEERKQRFSGGARRSSATSVEQISYHFDLHAHDAKTTERLWKKRLLTVRAKDGGHNAQARILGPDGDAVWLFLHDQPIALAARDGSTLADGSAIDERNAELKTVMPKEQEFFAFDGGLIITAADARRYQVRAPEFKAEPYQPPNEEYFSRVQFMATRWNGGYHTREFLHARGNARRPLDRPLQREGSADAGDDGFGDKFKDSSRMIDEGARARRTFWTARIGQTKEFSEGSHDRLFDVTRVAGAPEFLHAGLLIRQGTKEALTLQNPDALLVLHRTRLDAEGRLALTRVDAELRPQWKASCRSSSSITVSNRAIICCFTEHRGEGEERRNQMAGAHRGGRFARWQHGRLERNARAQRRRYRSRENQLAERAQTRALETFPSLSPSPARRRIARRGPAEPPARTDARRSGSRRRATSNARDARRHRCNRC